MAPIATPTVKAGDDPRAALAAAFVKANSRLKQSRAWYDGISTQGK